MALDAELLAILVCPETHQPLTVAADELVANLNSQIAAGSLVSRSGETITEPLDGGLVRQDGTVLYPVRDEIPEMLIDSQIALPPA
ncbi:MAG: hypothetical protein IT204_19245 [Fimbriimonadaceae bacterium]|nr:hypothetical protein [Fimbriimonadaceae bacterium]